MSTTLRKLRITSVQLHLLDTLLLRFANLGTAKIWRIAVSVLEHTNGMWINPQACEATPEDLVAELLDVEIPIEHILQNEEKSQKLVKTTVLNKSLFYDYSKAVYGAKGRNNYG
jgi:hypothetical protein